VRCDKSNVSPTFSAAIFDMCLHLLTPTTLLEMRVSARFSNVNWLMTGYQRMAYYLRLFRPPSAYYISAVVPRETTYQNADLLELPEINAGEQQRQTAKTLRLSETHFYVDNAACTITQFHEDFSLVSVTFDLHS